MDGHLEIAESYNLKSFSREVDRDPHNIKSLLLLGHSYSASKSYQDALGIHPAGCHVIQDPFACAS